MKTIASIVILAWLINLLIPVVLCAGGFLVNFMFRTEFPFVEYADKYQSFKWSWLFGNYMESDDHAIAYFMLDLICGTVLMLISLFVLEQSAFVWLLIATPFIVRFLTGVGKKYIKKG